MAIKLLDKPNVESVSYDYPYGNIKDNPGDNTGTPVNKLVYADFHQFFAKLMDDAGISYNGLPDNATDGFQYFLALQKVIKKYCADFEDISSTVTLNSAVFSGGFTQVYIRKFPSGKVEVRCTLQHANTVAANTDILSGLPIPTIGGAMVVTLTDSITGTITFHECLHTFGDGKLVLREAISTTNIPCYLNYSYYL